MQEQIDALKKSASEKQARIKELDELLRMADYYQQGKPRCRQAENHPF